MVEEDHLYISVGQVEYKANKSNVLNSQADLLKMLKHSYNLKVLEGQKKDLRTELASIVASIRVSIEKLQGEIPSPSIPSSLGNNSEEKIEELKEVEAPKKAKKKKEHPVHLDNELVQIQEKLRELNS